MSLTALNLPQQQTFICSSFIWNTHVSSIKNITKNIKCSSPCWKQQWGTVCSVVIWASRLKISFLHPPSTPPSSPSLPPRKSRRHCWTLTQLRSRALWGYLPLIRCSAVCGSLLLASLKSSFCVYPVSKQWSIVAPDLLRIFANESDESKLLFVGKIFESGGQIRTSCAFFFLIYSASLAYPPGFFEQKIQKCS